MASSPWSGCQVIRIWLLAVVFTALVPSCVAASARVPLVIRVGVADYGNVERNYERYLELFRELADRAGADQPVTFTVAVGDFNEVMGWYLRRMVDVVVLPAMPTAQLIANTPDSDLAKLKESYVGTLAVHLPSPAAGKHALWQLFPKDDEMAHSRAAYGADLFYRITLVVADRPGAPSPLRSVADLSDKRFAHRVKYIFLRPFSIAGYVLPAQFLRDHQIDPAVIKSDFSYQPQNALQRIAQPLPGEDDDKLLVAFSMDTASYGDRSQNVTLRRLEGASALEQARVPLSAVLVNQFLDDPTRQKIKAELSRLFELRRATETRDSEFRVKVFPADEWVAQYTDVRSWLQQADLPRRFQFKSTLEEIITDLKAYKSAGKTPRLALVLSGGGAKCAYQVGAIDAIENRLSQEREKSGGKDDLDIDLVVGTSGGSINALMVALGVTRDDAGRKALNQTWSSFRQQDFLAPSLAFNFIFGFTLGVLQALFFAGFSLLFGQEKIKWRTTLTIIVVVALFETVLGRLAKVPATSVVKLLAWEAVFLLLLLGMLRLLRKISKDWWRVAGYAMVIFSVAQLVAARMREPLALQTAFPENHVIHHFWPILALTGLWSFPCPLLLGLAMLATGRRRVPQVHWHANHVRAIGWIVGATLVAFVWYVFWIGGSLSTTSGVKQALASQLPGLMQAQHVALQSDPHADADSRLEDLSGQIVTRPAELITRDLIITASRLPAAESPRPTLHSASDTSPRFVEPNLMPEDLYFYYDSSSGKHVQPPAQEPRFIPLRRNPTKLLSVVVGSSTIYPVFAPQALRDIDLGRGRGPGLRLKEINVVDGGFIHNSPIEAAYLWGATHILLIEASPKTPDIAPRNFMESAMQALGFLFAQAQRVDTLSRGSVEIYTLRPSSQCERMEAHHSCDSTPDPDLDVFDFGQVLVMHAVDMGRNDVVPDNPLNRPRPLFTRIPGPPLFRSLSEVKGQAAALRP
jgi:predicted acylesterase/phospholipase RssA